jgi:ribonuclease-3
MIPSNLTVPTSMADAETILERLLELTGLRRDSPALEQALTHPSHANERPGSVDNQRLEFLGDAVLGLCASELIYRSFPDADEGMLTRLRAQLVNADALAYWARTAEISVLIKLGRGAASAGLRDSTNVLADTVEALIAASYLEAGLEGARRLSAAIVELGLTAAQSTTIRDAKSELQERLQALGRPAPSYEVLEASGPAHERWFRVRVTGVGAQGEGEGRSKRAAEQAAAGAALAELSAAGALADDEAESGP